MDLTLNSDTANSFSPHIGSLIPTLDFLYSPKPCIHYFALENTITTFLVLHEITINDYVPFMKDKQNGTEWTLVNGGH